MNQNGKPIRPNDRKTRFTVAALAFASSLALLSARVWPVAGLYLWIIAAGLMFSACLSLVRFHGLSKRAWGWIVLLLLLPWLVSLVKHLLFS
ncbi:MAG: hypothetical protein NT075_36540 [Chloroflexi bacterium]|nr:hypothetical protein [Chloroflexota bacterium]